MNQVFSIGKGLQVPDGTMVHPFLNPKDSESSLPFDLIEGFSMAAGEIPPHGQSKIHVMPLVTQVTLVLCGELEVIMKDFTTPDRYHLHLVAEQAIVTRPGTFFQIINQGGVTCRVLYLVSPGYVFLKENDRIIYDDALVLAESWQTLAELNWQPPSLGEPKLMLKARMAALKQIEERAAG